MKINEILTEGIASGLAGAAKGLAKGVKELPGKAVAGYQAGATPDITPATGYQTGAVQPKTPGAQYTSDIASAIRAGASGDISFKQATPTAYDRAPVGTKIGQWEKTSGGWINSNNSTAANPTQAANLDKEWTKFAQKDAKAKAQAQAQAKTQAQAQAKTQAQQQSTQSSQTNQQQANWQSTQPAATMADNGDIFAGDTQQPQLKLVQTVITPTGQKVFKKSDNKWYRESGTLVDTPKDIKQLNQMVINAKELAKAKGTRVPKIIQAQSTQPTKTHTGGRQKGGLSQTPNAIRKRAARAEIPAVFTSNRR